MIGWIRKVSRRPKAEPRACLYTVGNNLKEGERLIMQEGGQRHDHETNNYILYGPCFVV